jgi:hypothetical protein
VRRDVLPDRRRSPSAWRSARSAARSTPARKFIDAEGRVRSSPGSTGSRSVVQTRRIAVHRPALRPAWDGGSGVSLQRAGPRREWIACGIIKLSGVCSAGRPRSSYAASAALSCQARSIQARARHRYGAVDHVPMGADRAVPITSSDDVARQVDRAPRLSRWMAQFLDDGIAAEASRLPGRHPVICRLTRTAANRLGPLARAGRGSDQATQACMVVRPPAARNAW